MTHRETVCVQVLLSSNIANISDKKIAMLILSKRLLETQQTICSEVASTNTTPFMQYHMDVHQLRIVGHSLK